MKVAAVYARFSTELQNDRSIEDQITLCRQYADREGILVGQVFADKAKSGSSIAGRDSLNMMLNLCYEGRFSYIIVEALDRLSRDMEDLAGIYKRLTHAGVEIRAVHEGKANTILVGLRGLVGQLYREDNIHKVRRGMAGLIEQGLTAGGRCYGYRSDPANKGKLIIVPEEADVVKRIFEEMAAGWSSRHVARGLNQDNIPPPRGTIWSPSTIHGSLDRGYGILHNQLYIGKIVWNKVHMIKDPYTGKRLSRANPRDQWKVAEAPEYRIIPQDLWDYCHLRDRKPRVKRLHEHRRPRRLLSGLLKCGNCGSGMSVIGADKSGKSRVACSSGRYSGKCPDPLSFYVDVIEDLTLKTLVDELRDPKLISRYLNTYHAERVRLNKELEKERSRLRRQMAEASRKLDVIIEMAAQNGSATQKDKWAEASKVYEEAKAELEMLPEPGREVAFHPQLLKRYEEQLTALRDTLATGLKTGDLPQSNALREIVHAVIVHRDANSRPRVVLEGTLNVLLDTPEKNLGISSNPSSCIGGSGRRT